MWRKTYWIHSNDVIVQFSSHPEQPQVFNKNFSSHLFRLIKSKNTKFLSETCTHAGNISFWGALRAKRPLLSETLNSMFESVRIKVDFHDAILVAKMTQVLYEILQTVWNFPSIKGHQTWNPAFSSLKSKNSGQSIWKCYQTNIWEALDSVKSYR